MSFKKNKILGIFANHTSSLLKYNISINNISFLKKNLEEIIIIDSINEIYASKLKTDLSHDPKIINHIFVENDCYFDFGKWINGLKLIDKSKYEYILFINDSIIISNDLNGYFENLNNLNNLNKNEKNINLYGYNDSNEEKYHYQSFLFMINCKIINNFIKFFESKKHLIKDLESLVSNIELNLIEIDKNRSCYFKIAEKYNLDTNLCYKNESLYKYLLLQENYGIFKLKRILELQNNYKTTIYGKNTNFFDSNFYKNKYNDLSHLSDKEAYNHFLINGQYEGRYPNNSIKNFILPAYYRKILSDCNILDLFDIPDDFDIYFYKILNFDLKDHSNLNSVYHYINHGIYEGRHYLFNNNLQFKNLNNFYKSVLKRIEYINDDKIELLPDDFNIKKYKELNSQVTNDLGNMGIIKHYYEIGMSENLYYDDKIFENLDINVYKTIFPNLENKNKEEIMDIFLKNNSQNGFKYKLPPNFNVLIYKSLYNDIRNFDEKALIKHYIEIGRNNNRIFNFDKETLNNLFAKDKNAKKIPKDFDCDTYKSLNPDLSNFSDDFLKKHYIVSVFINQKRIYKIPSNYDQNIYKIHNPDLAHLNGPELFDHFITFGIREKRIYSLPKDFNVIDYKSLNNDLQHFNNNELIEHFIKHGMKEKRPYK